MARAPQRTTQMRHFFGLCEKLLRDPGLLDHPREARKQRNVDDARAHGRQAELDSDPLQAARN